MDADGYLSVLPEDLEALEGDKIEPFSLSTALTALCENAAAEFIAFLNVSLEDLKYGKEELRIINPNFKYSIPNCLDENFLLRVDHLGDGDSNVSDA